MGTKFCVGCKVLKDESEYNKNACNTTGLQSRCRVCLAAQKKKIYWENRDKYLAANERYRKSEEGRKNNKEYYLSRKNEYKERYSRYMSDQNKVQAKRDREKEHYKKNRERILARNMKNYRRPEIQEKIREKHHLRKSVDIEYNIKRRLRFRLRHIIKALGANKYKRMSSVELLGCEMHFFKNYIEDKFTEGMSWDRLAEIHIDHIKPCVKFDLTKIDEQKICFHYTNLQPLWKADNLKKNDKYPYKIAS